MKFFVDNNFPLHFAGALKTFSLAERDVEDVVHLREKYPANEPDLDWIKELSCEGGWCVISHDRFAKNKMEKEAFYRSDMVVFVFSKGWSDLQYWEKASKLVKVWPNLIQTTKLISGGAYEVQVNGKINQTKLT